MNEQIRTMRYKPALLSLLLVLAAGPLGSTRVVAESHAEPDWTTRDCLLEPHMVVDLSSPVSGMIGDVRVDRGDRVKKGQRVVQLRADVERAVVNLNRAQLRFGRTTVERNRELFQQNLISTQELDELRLKSDLARLELAVASARLEQKAITSPVNGVVLERLMDPGEFVSEVAILRIAALDPLHVEAVLPKEMFGSIEADAEAEVLLEEPLGGIHQVKVLVVDQVIDAASGTFRIRLLLPNPDNRIPAGIKCRLRMVQ